MIRPRVIPVLLMKDGGLYKTKRFKDPVYVGDPINAMRIFNDKEVDEIILLDISATPQKREPDFERISEIVSESFMPLAYGGGISTYAQAMRLFEIGIEKVVINSAAYHKPELISQIAAASGNQSVVVSMDISSNLFTENTVFIENAKRNTKISPVAYAKRMEELGAGELMITSIVREGTMIGYDIGLLQEITRAVSIPVIAHGGAKTMKDFQEAITLGHASAVAAGSMFVFQGPHRAVLISYPTAEEVESLAYAT